MKFPKVRTFCIEESRKKQAVKVLEEAAEFVEAAKHYECFEDEATADFYRRRMMEEACDVLVSLANALEMFDADKEELKDSMLSVELMNRARGRYED